MSSIPRNAGTPQRVFLAGRWAASPRPIALLELRYAPRSPQDASVLPIPCTMGSFLAGRAVLSVPHLAGHSHLSRFQRRLSDGCLEAPLQGFAPPASPGSTPRVATLRFTCSFHGFYASSRSGRVLPPLRSLHIRRRAKLERPEGLSRPRIPPLVPRRLMAAPPARSLSGVSVAAASPRLCCNRPP